MTFDQEPTYKALDDAILAHFREQYPDFATTGWVVLGTGMQIANLPEDAYEAYRLLYQQSAGTNLHTTLGLLAHATNEFMNPSGDDE